MTDKLKKRARELAAKSGMSYQAAHNHLTRMSGTPAESPTSFTPAAPAVSELDAALRSSRMSEPPDLKENSELSAILELVMAPRARGFHEPNCPLSDWDRVSTPEPPCECLGIDYSLPLLDGDDYYD